jgi:hypothetical protein
VLVLVHERWSDCMLVLVDVLNGQLGSTLHQLLLAPLTLIDVLGSYVLPVYNLAVYVLVRIPLQMLVWVLQGNGFSHLIDALTMIRGAAGAFVVSTKMFVISNGQTCSSMQCSNSTGQCVALDAPQTAVQCLDVAGRELDFMPAFGKLQGAVADLNLFVGDSCSFLAIVANVTLFPLSDPDMWGAVDRILNAFLHTVVAAPSLAISRCGLAGGIQARPSMCTPDFGPTFDKIAEAGLRAGNALTNWMDATYLFLFRQTNLQSVCDSSTKLSVILWADPVVRQMFGSNTTVLTRMGPDGFAVSDGNSVVFIKSLAGQLRKTYAPNLWPVPVNPLHGIARTVLPSGVNAQDNGLGLLGCRCSDQSNGAINITCSIVTQDGTAWDVPMRWSLASETQLLTCDRLRIVVQSVRWSHKRVIANTVDVNGQRIRDNSDVAADVAIYAIPICGAADGFKAMACRPERIFTRGVCFPYCMALRLLHEGFGPLTMRGALEWQQGVLMAMRSCVPTSTAVAPTDVAVQTACSLSSSDVTGGEAVATSADSCSYAYSCTTIVLNKTVVQGYAPKTSASSSSWDGSHLLLSGQPLVVGGDVFMRMFSLGASNYVDFPTVVGNQVGEFTVEANSPVGIPVTPPAAVPSQSAQAEVRGEIYAPVEYVQGVVPYNPGTLTQTALWYASNPSYDWIRAMAVYCASKGHDVQTQIMLLSSYAPLRIWRVLYHDYENCYITNQKKHVCVPDVAVATSLEKQIQILSSKALKGSTTLYDMCATETKFNLWVESMEYYDDLNVAVAVRQGTLADLGTLLAGRQAGQTVVYFFNASNITQPAQEGDPFKTTYYQGPNGLNTCPAFKVLPDVGAIVGHAVAAVSNLFKMPVNLILNPFAVLELLQSRASSACPENSLGHSVLANCGMSLLSLDAFFTQAYAANDAVWNVGYWLLSTLLPQDAVDNSQEARTFRSFLQGALIVGDATKVVGMFDIIHSVEFMDSGVQGALLGARRRLLGAKLDTLGNILSGLQSGFSSLLSLGQSVVGMATMSASAGTNFGMLISSQDPTVRYAGAMISAPSIAWAQFTYQASLPIVLDVLSVAKAKGTFSLTPVWMHLHDAGDLFENIVQARTKRACTGLRVMLGYSGSLGKALYYNCLAGQEMVSGTMKLLMLVTVDVPLYRCLCVLPAGEDYVSYVQDNCMPLVPPTRKSFWQRTMFSVTLQSSETMHTVCAAYAADIEQQMYGAFDAWKAQAIRSAESVATMLDELFVADAHAGSCQNTVSNPSSVVLTPLPLSHYQVCARTKACKERCADANSIFEYELQRLQSTGLSTDAAMQEYPVVLESPLFNRYTSATNDNNNNNIVAIRTLPANNSVYGCQARCSAGSCLAVASMQANSMQVEFFCLPDPSMILATVYSTNLDSFQIDTSPLTKDGGVIRGVDFSLQNSGVYVIVYVFKVLTAIDIKLAGKQLQSHEVHVYSSTGVGVRVLRSEDLANRVLGQGNVQQILFEGGQAVKPEVSNCRISSIVEIASASPGQLVFFIAFTADIKSWVTPADSSGGAWSENTYSVFAIFKWSEAGSSLAFFPPCSSACDTPNCGGTCHPQLEDVLSLAATGTFVHIDARAYLYVPSYAAAMMMVGTTTASYYLRNLQIDPINGLIVSSQKAPKTRLSSTADNALLLGTWTRASMFGSIAAQRQLRDASAHGKTAMPFPFFFQAESTFSPQWLQEIRLGNGNAGAKLRAFTSQQTVQTAKAQTRCTTLSCSGCTTSNLRLLCHQAQNCALSKCLGTIVQTKNALCGIGGLIQQSFIQAVTTWHAMYMIAAELALLVAKDLMGEASRVIVLKFPTEQFYSLMCACKDMLASVVGLCMSVGQVLSNMLAGKGLDLTGGQDVGALVGEQSLKMISIGGFFFNCITGMTLLPLMAMHRWVLCMADASLVATTDIGVSIRFGDVNMDTTWMQCAHTGSAFDILNNNNIQIEIQSVAVMFVKFVITLVTGIGETLLFGLELFWDSFVDFLIGVVFGIQDMLYTFNLRACKVPNYALRYVMWCSCQDEAYMIPPQQRKHGIADGALWCVGTLSMTLLDGSVGIIYNPYTMDELSAGVRGVTGYINCLSENSNPNECTPPGGEASALQTLVDQSVDPIAVWARCKSNYVQGVWDIGAGALFSADTASGVNGYTDALQTAGLLWGNGLGQEFMLCMRDDSRLLVDYSSCMRLFFSLSLNATPSAYYLYQKAPRDSTEPPDACLVFSGLNASAPVNSTLQALMSTCSRPATAAT